MAENGELVVTKGDKYHHTHAITVIIFASMANINVEFIKRAPKSRSFQCFNERLTAAWGDRISPIRRPSTIYKSNNNKCAYKHEFQ